MKTIKTVLIALVTFVAMSSCQKEILPNPDPKTMDELVIQSTFDWKTTSDYDFTLNGTSSHLVQIMSTDGAIIYKKGFLIANAPFVVHLTLPSYVNAVTLRYFGQSVEVPLTSKSISYTFN